MTKVDKRVDELNTWVRWIVGWAPPVAGWEDSRSFDTTRKQGPMLKTIEGAVDRVVDIGII